MKKSIFIVLITSFLLGCGGNTAINPSPNTTGNSGTVANNTNTSANTNLVVPNTNFTNAIPKPTIDNSPKRIAFNKGANWGTANVTLASGASQLFVVSAKSGQTMEVESSSKEIAINLRKGKAETTEDFGFLNAELQSNGDFVFEIKNTSRKEVKTSIKVTIEGGTVKSDGEGQGGDDGDKPESANKS